ncbi:MAG: DUF1566 domain-containing protein [Rectinemataceae bacterium]
MASSVDIADKDFLASRDQFARGKATGAIRNEGELRAAEGGLVALLAPEVVNEGEAVLISTRAWAAPIAVGPGFVPIRPATLRSKVSFPVQEKRPPLAARTNTMAFLGIVIPESAAIPRLFRGDEMNLMNAAFRNSIDPKRTIIRVTLAVSAAIMIGGCASLLGPTLMPVGREAAYVGSYPIVGTSQTGFWDKDGTSMAAPASGDAYYGQDAQFPRVVPSYTASEDGLTVQDKVTGLTWQKNQASGSMYWGESQTVIDSLNKQNYGGYSDWRLPTIKELYSLWNESSGWPSIDSNYFDITYSSQDELSHAIFWSSTKYAGRFASTTDSWAIGKEMAFGVNFGTGHIKAYTIDFGPKHFVRCVRGNLAYGVNLFEDKADGSITDLATKLMWSKADSLVGMDWEAALAYAQTKNAENYLRHNDWRLPNAKELQSIVNYSRSPGATDADKVGPAIDPLFSCTGITNEDGDADYPWYWTSTSTVPIAGGNYLYAWYVAFGRAVDADGEDLHGAGAVRFDTKSINSERTTIDSERVTNYVRLVRDAN